MQTTTNTGTTIDCKKDGKFLVITVTKTSGATAEYKAHLTNKIKDSKLTVCREDGTWVEMPIANVEELEMFMLNRQKVTFDSIDERNKFAENNEIGKTWIENDKITAYQYI